MRLKSIAAVLILAAIPSFAHADDKTKMAKIQELFEVSKMHALITQSQQLTMQRVKSGMLQRLYGIKLNADQQERLNDFLDKIETVVTDAMDWKTLEPQYAKIYADAYTEQQIDDLLAFYKSPTGQVMVQKNPILMSEANAIVNQRMDAALPQIRQLMQDFLKQEAALGQKEAEKKAAAQKPSKPEKSEQKQ